MIVCQDTGAKAPGIYVHVPFCRRKCPYCDFYSITEIGRLPAYVEALLQEIQRVRKPPCPCDTVYIGGGTPSLLSPGQMESLLAALFDHFVIARDVEITLEVNPGSVSAEELKQYRAAGINRLNVGVQSFNDCNLGFLGRIHTSLKAFEVIGQARAAGFDHIGLDLIYGLPRQSMNAWHRDLSAALELSPEHLSCYLLTYAPGTPLMTWVQAKQVTPLPEADRGEMFLFTHDFLLAQGYTHYEVSNFARSEDFMSRHNQKYWHGAPYIGLGPAAHSYFSRRRHWNVSDVNQYIVCLNAGNLPIDGYESLTVEQEIMEAIFLGLRCRDGLYVKSFEARFNLDFKACFHTVLSRCQAAGYLTLGTDRCLLTREGLLMADSIAQAFIECL